jgi:ABC-type antimicrobial peptide transport system permease subunit
VTSAQLTGVLQRQREFSVLLALGMRPARLSRLVFTEAGLLGVGGGLLSLLLAAAPLWYLSHVGLDISKVMGSEGMAMGGVLMDPVIKADVGIWVLGFAFIFSLFTALLGAIYPTFWSRRLDPATTLRARN